MKRIHDSGDSVLSRHNLERYNFILVTLHRAENTDNPKRLEQILKALNELSQFYPVVFPIHPRTRSAIAKFDLSNYLSRVKLMDPLGYFEFLALLLNCRVVLTDSGGVQEEAFTLKIPTVTLRYNTERPETTLYDINVLAGADAERIINSALMQAERVEEIRRMNFENPFGDGQAGKRIVQILKEAIEMGLTMKEPDLRETPLIEYRLMNEGDDSKDSIFDLLAAFNENGKPTFTSKFRLARIKGKFDDKYPQHSNL